MKIYFKFFLLLFMTSLLYSTVIYSQEIDYFPLQDGNFWEYYYHTFPPEYMTMRVMGDTLMPNGKTYKNIHEVVNYSFYNNYFIRKDSNLIYYYFPYIELCDDSEFVWLDFNAPDSTVWKVCRDWDNCGNAMGIGITFYNYNYWDFYHRPLLTKSFSVFLIDSSDTVWNPCGTTDYYISEDIGIIWQKMWSRGEYWLNGAIINGVKYGTIVSVKDEYELIPQAMEIHAYPNPFNSTVSLDISLNNDEHTVLLIYNTLGERVDNLFDGWLKSGIHRFRYQADHLSSGIYLAVLKQGYNMKVQKLILIK
jgi:hypothetical protein